MSLLSRLTAAAAAAFGRAEGEVDPHADEHLAVVALLAHVARADGRVDARERGRLAGLVSRRFGVPSEEAEAMIDRAMALDDEVRDLAELVEMAGPDAQGAERLRLLEMAWAVAAADGRVHEFEEALVSRLAEILGFDPAQSAAARASAIGEAAVAERLG